MHLPVSDLIRSPVSYAIEEMKEIRIQEDRLIGKL